MSDQMNAVSDEGYLRFINGLAKPGEDILRDITPKEVDILHMAFALPGEVGELCDAIKKAIIYRKHFDRGNAVEELGDIKFYLTRLMHLLEITDEECRIGNIKKLSKRYSSGSYSDNQAQQRADKESQ